MKHRLSTLVLCLVAFGYTASAFATTYTVDSLAALQQRINNAQPGDTIVIKDGTYTVEQMINVTSVGTKERPITIKAETVGGVELVGPQGLSVRSGAAHIIISGINFLHDSGRTNIAAGAQHIRITRCTFAGQGRGAFLTVAGDDIEIDHNLFRDKNRFGNMLDIRGVNGQVARRVHVHHNHFRDFSRSIVAGETNDLEVIRFGLSGLSMSTGDGIVEYNLFERCVGENELISNKSSGNIYRYNTFLDSRGSELSLRHGNDVKAYRNYFHGTQGIRIFGDRHEIFENFISHGNIGIHIGNGGAKIAETNAPLTSHDRPDDTVIRNNVLLNNQRHYIMARRNNGLGAHRASFVENTIIGGNIVARIEGPYPDPVWRDNIVWNVGEIGDMPESGFRRADPGEITPESMGIRVLTPADVGPAAYRP